MNRKFLRAVPFVFFTIMSSGCTTLKYESNKDPNYSGNIKYLAIVESMASAPFTNTFNTNLTSMLGKCGISTFNLNIPINEDAIRAVMAKNNATERKLDSSLSIAAVAFTKNGYGSIISYDYELILRDARGQKVWKAQMTFMSDSIALVGKDKGQALASDIITHMNKDGVLAGCSPPSS
jgi:hypothetical protein